ncbi:hypothetical protein ACFO0U_02570 [Chromohalobacter sarecensis]|uniref:Uncharacterized protein n=1 Tax=Chromohalobacter sarecensis TaxID=245294 RepID=A0ABV9CWL3_9GAMM|nr:hypothetical protein [Chromohalobacter sarecensis]MCK0714804.1 hypothetical protein [Chromohalobacter sarecensis]
MNSDFHIGISYQEDLPSELIEEYISSISEPELKIRADSREIGFYASIEWALPTIVIVYLSKPYFEAFLQEAGKDHYQLLKKGTLKLFNRLYGSKPEKRDKKRSQLFSAMVQLKDDRSLKFVFPEGVGIEQYEKSLELMHELLLKHYVDYPNDQITEMASQLSAPSRSLYIEYKAEKEGWVLIDPLVEAQKARKAQNEHNK